MPAVRRLLGRASRLPKPILGLETSPAKNSEDEFLKDFPAVEEPQGQPRRSREIRGLEEDEDAKDSSRLCEHSTPIGQHASRSYAPHMV